VTEPTDEAFNLTEIEDDDDSFGVLNSMNDRYDIKINAEAIESNTGGLETGEKLRLEITSRTGGTTQVILTMPQQTAGKEEGNPVEL
jgi:flagellin FlaB